MQAPNLIETIASYRATQRRTRQTVDNSPVTPSEKGNPAFNGTMMKPTAIGHLRAGSDISPTKPAHVAAKAGGAGAIIDMFT